MFQLLIALSVSLMLFSLFLRREYILTGAILAANVFTYLLTTSSNGYIQVSIETALKYGLSMSNIKAGAYWTLLTSAFIHANLLHLSLNMYALYIFGTICENHVGSVKAAILYVISLLGSDMLSLIVLPAYTPTVGASGAIFGYIGLVLSFDIITKKVSISEVATIIIWVLGMGMAGVNVAAHAAGLLVGLLFGLMYKPQDEPLRHT